MSPDRFCECPVVSASRFGDSASRFGDSKFTSLPKRTGDEVAVISIDSWVTTVTWSFRIGLQPPNFGACVHCYMMLYTVYLFDLRSHKNPII